ncbi:YbaB/EbfC family nucleoid-associated protein [Nocardia sp. NBC_01329]|uniref:YbaB/EbfC family nucleoid-associated protein n=1 Tax=Nocardia sp. NBC_01329 TaxID=2903594 RepID=UPI002E12FD3C|nr:YbaB/EbfC family nucleoid-associated protein [Nocardia sp. NBC_01329]
MAAEMDLDGAIAGFARMAADAERRAQQFAELQQRMTALTATESGAGGRVSVTVDSSGVPTAIDLAPSVREMDSRVLSAEILTCMRRAQGKLRPGVAGLVQDIVGADPAGAALVDGFDRRFPEPETGAASAQNSGPPQADRPPPPAADPTSPRHRPTPPTWGSAFAQQAADPTSSQHRPTPPTGGSAPPPAPRKPDRDQVVTPDEPDEEDEYYRRKSWLE